MASERPGAFRLFPQPPRWTLTGTRPTSGAVLDPVVRYPLRWHGGLPPRHRRSGATRAVPGRPGSVLTRAPTPAVVPPVCCLPPAACRLPLSVRPPRPGGRRSGAARTASGRGPPPASGCVRRCVPPPRGALLVPPGRPDPVRGWGPGLRLPERSGRRAVASLLARRSLRLPKSSSGCTSPWRARPSPCSTTASRRSAPTSKRSSSPTAGAQLPPAAGRRHPSPSTPDPAVDGAVASVRPLAQAPVASTRGFRPAPSTAAARPAVRARPRAPGRASGREVRRRGSAGTVCRRTGASAPAAGCW